MKKRESKSTWDVARDHVQGWLGTAGHVVAYLPNKFIALVSPSKEEAARTPRSKSMQAKTLARKKAR